MAQFFCCIGQLNEPTQFSNSYTMTVLRTVVATHEP